MGGLFLMQHLHWKVTDTATSCSWEKIRKSSEVSPKLGQTFFIFIFMREQNYEYMFDSSK